MKIIFLFNIGGSELFLIFVVALLLFGGKGLPALARTLGRASREFRDAAHGIKKEIYGSVDTDEKSIVREIEEKIQEVKKELPKTD